MSVETSPVENGLYIFLTMRSDPGDAHWGLYLHHTTILPQPVVVAEPSDTPNQVSKRRTVPRIVYRGKKYHIRNLGEGFFADHAIVGDMLETLFLIGLLQVGVIPPEKIQLADTLICQLDQDIPRLPLHCRGWVLSRLRALLDNQLLQSSVTDDVISQAGRRFAEEEWETAEKAIKPRPIRRSEIFLF